MQLVAVFWASICTGGCAVLSDGVSPAAASGSDYLCLSAPQQAAASLRAVSPTHPHVCDQAQRRALLEADAVFLTGLICLQHGARQEPPSGQNSARALVNEWLAVADLAMERRCADIAARIYGQILVHGLPLPNSDDSGAASSLAFHEHARTGLDVARSRQRKITTASRRNRGGRLAGRVTLH